MTYNDFVGEVQHRIGSATPTEAVRTVRSVLETLGERLMEGEAKDLAGSLPIEIDRYLLQVDHGKRYSYEEFIDRVMEKMNYEDIEIETPYAVPAPVDRSNTLYRIKAVVALLDEEIPVGEIDDIRQQLPGEFQQLFEFADAEEVPWEEE